MGSFEFKRDLVLYRVGGTAVLKRQIEMCQRVEHMHLFEMQEEK